MTFEDPGQVTLVRESAFSCDLREGDIRLFEQMLCSFDALAQHKLVRAFPHRLPEQAGKMIGAEASLLSQSLEREVLAEMSQDEVCHLFHLLARQPL